ncbi:MAG: dienelactone hydrolase family protein [Methylococcaceae bacterium]|nr:dienelactone hydrolase family protein [Methylococcaceae bacterium]
MAVVTRPVEYHHGSVRLQGLLSWDDAWAAPRPAVLVSHAWIGRDPFACGKAQDLTKLGYVGFALDMYGDGRTGSGPEENARLMQPFMEDRVLLQGRIGAALNAARAQPEVDPSRVAAIGFCFGGLCVLDLARSGADLGGVVSFHGLLSPPGNTAGRQIGAKVLVLHGYEDPLAPAGQLTALASELTEAGADWQIHAYGGTLHAFTNPRANDPAFGTVYKEIAARRSWQAMGNFLAEVLN